MAEICENFRLRDARKPDNQIKKLSEMKSVSISQAAESLNMNVADFLHYIGRLEREGKLKIKFL
jgi:hypothetical protein